MAEVEKDMEAMVQGEKVEDEEPKKRGRGGRAKRRSSRCRGVNGK